MELKTVTTILRHGVPVLESGLSPMQESLLHMQAPVCVASAPTGAGKSYVYRKAVEAGERVMFVVPTRRLAQDQHASMQTDFRNAGWKEADVQGKIVMWTGDTANDDRERGINVRFDRLSKLPLLRYGDKGEIIFITPETLSWMLMRPFAGGGIGDVNSARLMSSFDRIVFDEAHLMQPRGLGLAAFMASLAATGPFGREFETGPVRAKVSLLSATPIDPTALFRSLGIPFGDSCIIAEDISSDGARSLHGDVRLEFVDTEKLVDLLEANLDKIAELPLGQCALFLHDSLRNLKDQEPQFRDLLREAGFPDERILFDNSIDAQTETATTGRKKSLDGRSVMVSTSTVEVGVTISGLTRLFMDPGFTPMSFLQRLGRAARGDIDGRVVVRLDKHSLSRRPWLANLVRWIAENDGPVTIQELTDFMSAEARIMNHFRPNNEEALVEEEIPTKSCAMFGEFPVRAAFNVGLYWNRMIDRLAESGMRKHAGILRKHAPRRCHLVGSWFSTLRGAREIISREWIKAFERQIDILRDFDPTISIVGPGRSMQVSEKWLSLHTNVLDHYPITIDKSGNIIVKVGNNFDWTKVLREDGRHGSYSRVAILPNGDTIDLSFAPLENYIDAAKRSITSKLFEQERDLAIKLITTTGLIPYADDVQAASGTGSGIL